MALPLTDHHNTLRRDNAAAISGRGDAFVGWALGIWLALMPVIELAMRPRMALVGDSDFDAFRYASPARANALVLVLLLCGPIALVAAWRLRVDVLRLRWLGLVVFANSLAITLSLIGVQTFEPLVYVGLVYYTFAAALLIAAGGATGDALLKGLFGGAAIGIGAVIVVAMIDNDSAYGRFWGHNAPNYWGAMAHCVLFGALCLKRRLLQALCVAVALIVMFWAQSRGAMLGVAAAGAVMLVIVVARSNAKRGAVILTSIVALTVLGAAVAGPFLWSKVLLIDDASRGAGSGATGRAGAWAQAWDLFASSPLIGVGYRQSEQYITAASSAHNAYLATLAETGLLGLLAYMAFLGGAIWRAVSRTLKDGGAAPLAAAGYLIAFAVTGLVERRALNTGNAASLMMIFVAAWMWRAPATGAVSAARQHWRRRGQRHS